MKIKVLSLRLPQQVAKELQKRAKAQNRSINGQIIYELDQKPKYLTETDLELREANIALTGQP